MPSFSVLVRLLKVTAEVSLPLLKTQVECRLSKRLRSHLNSLSQQPPTGIGVKAHCQTNKTVQDWAAVVMAALKPNDHQPSAVATKRSMSDYEQLLEQLNKVLVIAKANGNKLFIENIERDIKALEAGEESPIIKEYLTPEERRLKDSTEGN
jgi:hypothetical protein